MSDQRSQSVASSNGVARHGRLKRPNPILGVLKFLGIGIVVVAVSAASVLAIDTFRLVSSADIIDIPFQTEGPPPDIGAMEGGFNILIVGSDRATNAEMVKERGKAELNDVTMLLHVSEDHTNAVAVSFPRDLVVPIPPCPKKDGSGNYPRMSGQPINVTLSYGGLACTILTVQELSGLTIDFAGLITFQGVVDMSTAVGGVPVCIAEDMNDKWTNFKAKAGTHVLEGWNALSFLRSRHGVGDGSDLTRISSQQVFLSSLVRTLKSDETLHDIPKLYNLANAAIANMSLTRNFGHPDVLVAVARALADLDLEDVTFVQFPGSTGGTGIYAGKVKPNATIANQLFAKIRADQPFAVAAAGDGRGSTLDPNATPLAPDPNETVDPSAPPKAAVPIIPGLRGQTAADQTCTIGRPVQNQ